MRGEGLCFSINLSFHWGSILADSILRQVMLSAKHEGENSKVTVPLSLSAAMREREKRKIRGYFLIICCFTHNIFHYQWGKKKP